MIQAEGGVRPRLFYIDDDEGLCRLVARSLGRRGLDVSTCCDPLEAVRALGSGAPGSGVLGSGTPDVVVLDHYMPGQDGLETLAQIQALPNPPPIVYVTGSEESRIAIAALKAGAADYVVKTGSEDFTDLLFTAVSQAVERERLKRGREAAERALKEANIRLEAVVERQEVLLREVNHRVANSLQLVSSLVHMQASALKPGEAREALKDTQARISAIMQIHRRLYTSDDVERVDMSEYLQGLVYELEHSLPAAGAKRSIRLQADRVVLATDRAVSLGVIVAELVTNAYKYAYAPDRSGEIRVRLEHLDRKVRLVVEDDGSGMADGGAPKGTGLGQKVIAAMASSLASKVEFDPDHPGVRALLAFDA